MEQRPITLVPMWCSLGNVDWEIHLGSRSKHRLLIYLGWVIRTTSCERDEPFGWGQGNFGLSEAWSSWKTHGQNNCKRRGHQAFCQYAIWLEQFTTKQDIFFFTLSLYRLIAPLIHLFLYKCGNGALEEWSNWPKLNTEWKFQNPNTVLCDSKATFFPCDSTASGRLMGY